MKKSIYFAVALFAITLVVPASFAFADRDRDDDQYEETSRPQLTAEQKQVIMELAKKGDINAIEAKFDEWGIEMPNKDEMERSMKMMKKFSRENKDKLDRFKKMNDPEEMREQMKEYAEEHDIKMPELTSEQIAIRDGVKASVEANDFDAFQKAVVGTPMEKMTQSDFDALVKLQGAISEAGSMKPEDMRMTLTKEQKQERREEMKEHKGFFSFFKQKKEMMNDNGEKVGETERGEHRGFFARLFAPKNY